MKEMVWETKGLHGVPFNPTIRVFTPSKDELKEWVLLHKKAQLDQQRNTNQFQTDLELYCDAETFNRTTC